MKPRRVFLLGLLVASVLRIGAAWAISDPSEMLPNPAEEARAEAIGSQLRCPVCQNESIEESDAGLARDIRAVIRQQVAAGKSNKTIIAYMVQRYGDFILLKPPIDNMTMLLWASPPGALASGFLVAVLAWRRRRASPAEALELTEDERATLDMMVRR